MSDYHRFRQFSFYYFPDPLRHYSRTFFGHLPPANMEIENDYANP